MRKLRIRMAATLAVTTAAVGGVVALTAPQAQAATCTASLGGTCGPYSYGGIPMSNGYNTYVANQPVGAGSGTRQTVSVADPGSWSVTANDTPYGYTGVQTFPDVQQLTNNWCGSGWSGCQNPSDTPLSALSALSVSYAESSPRDANSIYEFAPDVWSNYPSDVMFWADTHGRCDEGAFGGTVLGRAVLAGQNWTVHRYGGAGAEIIFVLDGAGGSGSCAQQSSGTIDIKAGFDWLAAHGLVSNPVISQLNTGWEITSADNTTFSVSSYSITATVGGSPAPTTPKPSPTSTSPTPRPTSTSPSPRPTSTSASPSPTSSGPKPTGRLLLGQRSVEPTVDSNPKGTAQAYQYVAAQTGTSATINFYVDAANTATAGKLGIYSNSDGDPGTLLTQVSFKPKAGWNTVAVSGLDVTAGRRYWLAELGTSGTLAYRDQSGSSPYSETKVVGTTLPAHWSGGTRWHSGDASLYVGG
jgi:hypothetical protein